MENPNPIIKPVEAAGQSLAPSIYEPSRPVQIEDVFSKLDCWTCTNVLISPCFPDLIRNINDPEHPLALEELNVVQAEHIFVNNVERHIVVLFTPTIPHCSMATLIGLCIKIKLQTFYPPIFWVLFLSLSPPPLTSYCFPV